ncbi:MAG: YmdB family metallophosphoesterase, partial [Thermodesulfobacteriota bacterium]
PMDSIIGMRKEKVMERFLTSMPVRLEVAKGDVELQGVYLAIDPENGRATEIKRIKKSLKKA